MINSNAVVNLNCNVNIKVLDHNDHVVRESNKHNKATVYLVDGILRFLQGDFTKLGDPGKPYLPACTKFGVVGVKYNIQQDPKQFDQVDYTEFIQPVFNSSKLQVEAVDTSVDPHRKFSYNFNSVKQSIFSDNNNAECLEFSQYLTPGKLVGDTVFTNSEDLVPKFEPYSWSYWNPETKEYEALLTEVGLFSSTGIMLARVLFDGKVNSVPVEGGSYPEFEDKDNPNNPIIQSQSQTVVLTWRIGIISIGKNDELVTESNLQASADNLAYNITNDYIITNKDSTPVSTSELSKRILQYLK